MRIKKIIINGFGKFEDRLFLLKPGMNVFYGCNESGKSTIQSFIKGMLYGLKGGKRAKDGTLPPIRQYRPWTAKAYGGSLEYQLDNGKAYTVARNFDRNTVTVYDGYSNNITGTFPAGKEEGVKFAEQHLGLSESCFERTVFIGQMQSIINNEGKKVIAERLTNIKQTGDEEVSFRKAMEALKEAQLTYVGSERTTTRPINIINSRLQEAISEEEECIRQHENCMDMFLELEKLRKREMDLKNELNKLNRLKTELDRRQETEKLENSLSALVKCRTQLIDTEKDICAKKESLDGIFARMNEYEAFGSFSRKDSDEMVSDYTNYKLLCKELEKWESENDENEERIKEIQNELRQYSLFTEGSMRRIDQVIQEVLQYNRLQVNNEEKTEKSRPGMKKHVSLAGLIVGVIVLIISFMLKPYSAVIAVIGSVISVVAGIFLLSSLRIKNVQSNEIEQGNIKIRKYRENTSLLNEWMKQVNVDNIHDFIRLKNMFQDKIRLLDDLMVKGRKIEDGKNNTLKSIEEFKTRILNRLISAKIVAGPDFDDQDVQKWRAGLEALYMLEQTAKDTETVLSSLNQKKESLYREASAIAGCDIKSVDGLEREILSKTNELERLKNKPVDTVLISAGFSADGMEPEIKQLSEELSHVALRINTLATRLENAPDGEMIQKAHEKVQVLTAERQKKLFLGKALDIAMEVLEEASVDLQRNYSPYLNEVMGNIMDTITGGKYSDIMADDSLMLNIQPPGMPERVIPEQLSSGTADQVYFALRLATIRLIEKDGETMPLFLDDPFVQYDEERTRNVLTLLCNESDRRQVILFTCKKREVELVRQVFGSKDVNVVNL